MYLILAIFAARIQHITTKYRRGRFNGLNTIQGTLQRNIDAPMVYRVLIPYLIRLTPRLRPEQVYEFWRTVLLWVSLLCVASYWGQMVAVIWLVFVLSAQVYDTWCYTGETIGITLALMGNPIGAALGIFVHGLSRETVLVNGFVYWLATGDITGGVLLSLLAAVVYLIVRYVQGPHPLYCDRFMLKRNWRILTLKEKPTVEGDFIPWLYGAWLNVALIILSLIGAWMTGRIGWTVPVMVLATVTMGKINEYRLQIPVSVWAAYVLERMWI